MSHMPRSKCCVFNIRKQLSPTICILFTSHNDDCACRVSLQKGTRNITIIITIVRGVPYNKWFGNESQHVDTVLLGTSIWMMGVNNTINAMTDGKLLYNYISWSVTFIVVCSVSCFWSGDCFHNS